jgi:hypothetical protein
MSELEYDLQRDIDIRDLIAQLSAAKLLRGAIP